MNFHLHQAIASPGRRKSLHEEGKQRVVSEPEPICLKGGRKVTCYFLEIRGAVEIIERFLQRHIKQNRWLAQVSHFSRRCKRQPVRFNLKVNIEKSRVKKKKVIPGRDEDDRQVTHVNVAV